MELPCLSFPRILDREKNYFLTKTQIFTATISKIAITKQVVTVLEQCTEVTSNEQFCSYLVVKAMPKKESHEIFDKVNRSILHYAE